MRKFWFNYDEVGLYITTSENGVKGKEIHVHKWYIHKGGPNRTVMNIIGNRYHTSN